MYTGVNDIMWMDHGPGSSLHDDLLASILKALTTYQFSVELVVPPALLEAMPTLDNVNIAPVQRGDLSRGMVIPGSDSLSGATGGRGQGGGPARGRGGISADGRGGGPASGGLAGGRGGNPAGSRGGVPTGA
jgi:hypothetical protein